MDISVKSQTTGSQEEIHGKLKDRMSLIKSGFMVYLTNTETETPKDLTGSIAKK
jgi:hypothetical protein